MQINQKTVDLVKQFEGLHDNDLSRVGLQPKLCPAGVYTIGYGRALTDSNGNLLRGKENEAEAYRQYAALTEQEAEAMLQEDLQEFSNFVLRQLIKLPTENQFGAMTSLAYNIGANAFKNSSVLRYFNQGDILKAADSFLLWTKATVKGEKVVLPGLVRRRKAERLLFLEDQA